MQAANILMSNDYTPGTVLEARNETLRQGPCPGKWQRHHPILLA